MEKMPYRPEMDTMSAVSAGEVASASTSAVTSDWQRGLPVLRGGLVTLREMRASDAASLCALLTTEEVSRFISPPPTTVDGFEKFIAWTHRQRVAGSYVCFAVTLRGFDTAIGIIQVRQSDRRFETAEWGFAIGSAFWGTGVFQESASMVADFAIDVVGVQRLEARAAVKNARGTAALRKLGAVEECVLRESFLRHGEYLDQALYAIVDADWRVRRAVRATRSVQVH